jgi:carbonic anhydrase
VSRLEHEGPLDASFSPHDQLSQLNVLVQLGHLMSYPIVRERVAAGTLRLGGCWFDIASGDLKTTARSTPTIVFV